MEANKITIEELNKVINGGIEQEVAVNWNGLDLIIKRYIALPEVTNFVKYVTELCFERDTNEYIPEVRDLAIKCFLIEHYTNIEMPKDISQKYEMIYSTDIIQTILNVIDPHQFNEIIQAIDIKLQYMADSNIESITQRMNELYDAFEKLENSLSDVFSGMTNESMQSLVDAISNGKFDESKLIDSYFNHKDKSK